MNYCDEKIRKMCGITMAPKLKITINDNKSFYIALNINFIEDLKAQSWNSSETLNEIVDKEIGNLPEVKRNIRKAKLDEIYSRIPK